MSKLNRIFDLSTRIGRRVALVIQVLIFISLISFSLETLPDLSVQTTKILRGIETATVLLFSLEYILRILTAESRLKYIFSFFGIVDLLAILPFYLTKNVDLRVVRIFRFVRLVRILKLAKHNRAINNLLHAFQMIKNELIMFFLVIFLLLFVASAGIYYFENPAQPAEFASIFHAFWWAVITLTSVGYGDIYPIAIGGKIFTSVFVLVGMGIIAIPTGLIASAMTSVLRDNHEKNM